MIYAFLLSKFFSLTTCNHPSYFFNLNTTWRVTNCTAHPPSAGSNRSCEYSSVLLTEYYTILCNTGPSFSLMVLYHFHSFPSQLREKKFQLPLFNRLVYLVITLAGSLWKLAQLYSDAVDGNNPHSAARYHCHKKTIPTHSASLAALWKKFSSDSHRISTEAQNQRMLVLVACRGSLPVTRLVLPSVYYGEYDVGGMALFMSPLASLPSVPSNSSPPPTVPVGAHIWMPCVPIHVVLVTLLQHIFAYPYVRLVCLCLRNQREYFLYSTWSSA